MLCVLLSYIFLVGPEVFQTLAQADVQYANLNIDSWGQADRTITYTYDANGSVESKTTRVTGSPDALETVTNHYNVAGRLDQVTTERGNSVEVAEYAYNDNGIRVKSEFTRTIDSVTDQQRITTYLIDSYNHTGYAQVLEEETVTTDYVSGEAQPPVTQLTTYIIGDDVIAQKVDGVVQYLLYDGHGSTRQLAEYSTGAVSIIDSYSYDGYGVLLQEANTFEPTPTGLGYTPGYTPRQATSLLYSGEQYDSDAQQYYLRARYYNPANGLFNRTDPYAGNLQDPQSLHKYAYCHNNPVNGIDPTGMFIGFSIGGMIGILVTQAKIFGMRTAQALKTWKQYSTAKRFLTVIGVSYVISTAFVEYFSGSAKLKLEFSKSPLLGIGGSKKWPDVTLGLTTDRKFFTYSVAYEAESKYTDGNAQGSGSGYIDGKFNLETGQFTGSGGLGFGVQLYPSNGKKGPIEANLEWDIKGPPFTIEVGMGIKFSSPWRKLGISTGFSLLKIEHGAGLSLLWGKPWDKFK